ncbi:hypothetical protein [Tianweitania sediminis]|uniref:Uncharacterized protein n=1 Tax=Tianweitania sediminis TaxID=1502156 RepID=A0A8J7R5G3_9HYPH|nr:hypothetical protein [Tianweitania sediminis]MBP0438057.1 hypothetical protein [Tianweitania sediminis]
MSMNQQQYARRRFVRFMEQQAAGKALTWHQLKAGFDVDVFIQLADGRTLSILNPDEGWVAVDRLSREFLINPDNEELFYQTDDEELDDDGHTKPSGDYFMA